MRGRPVQLLLCLSLALALGACGGGSDDPGVVSAPEPTTELADHLAAQNEAIAAADCKATAEQQFSQRRPTPKGLTGPVEPGDPVTSAECAAAPGSFPLAVLQGAEFTATEENGPAAVSEGTASKDYRGYGHFALLSLVDLDGRWRWLTFFQAEPQSDPPSPDADPGAVVDELVAAARSGDCSGAAEIFDPIGSLAGGEGKIRNPEGAEMACETLVEGELFAPSVKETPEGEIEPEELVTTRDISIWGVPTKEAYYAVFLGTPPHEIGAPPEATFQVSDVVALTEAEPG